MSPPPTPPPEQPDLRDADAVCDLLRRAARAARDATCRKGSIDHAHAPGRLVASGDLHDNPFTLAALVDRAALDSDNPAHLTLHELIHPEHLVGGADFSYRALVRAAALKVAHPEHVHVLLANHELSQIVGAGIVKDGVRVVDAFNDGVDLAFAERADDVHDAIGVFVRSLALALRVTTAAPDTADILCAHSLPAAHDLERFDHSVFDRPLTDDDYTPRRGSAHLMVWGRDHTPDLLADLAERWGVALFILGHEEAPSGAMAREPNALILNSHHEHGAYLDLDLSRTPSLGDAASRVRRLT